MSGDGPNPILAGWSMLRARRVRSPQPDGAATANHEPLAEVLAALANGGIAGLADQQTRLGRYRATLEAIHPDRLARSEALAYWINLYNAGALDLAATAARGYESSVLRVPGAFRKAWATVAGEELSLNDIEHGKIRRFGDPRIHSALVCGSASCPTLRYQPFRGEGLDSQLDDQMGSFLAAGGALYDPAGRRLTLSRVFLWYGADFVRPHRMPTLIPARKSAIGGALARWLQPEDRAAISTARVEFASYDWGLACSIG